MFYRPKSSYYFLKFLNFAFKLILELKISRNCQKITILRHFNPYFKNKTTYQKFEKVVTRFGSVEHTCPIISKYMLTVSFYGVSKIFGMKIKFCDFVLISLIF